MAARVFVGLSGGVDSSLSAALLKEQGLAVTGVYMKNWSRDIAGFSCPWRDDYRDAKRIAVQLGIDFKLYDFESEYKERVVDYMVAEYQAGRTPNPDIMCNQEVKFKLFLATAMQDGADFIATGHYATTKDGQLLMAADAHKDQTYFLYRVDSTALSKTIFPLSQFNSKAEVRAESQKRGLVTADKKDSQGICFVGSIGIRDFLSQYVETEPGDIIDQTGQKLGRHSGAIFYTIGQRHGLDVGGGLPYYVTHKDMQKNEVYVTNDIADSNLWTDTITLVSCHWISGIQPQPATYGVRVRHGATLVNCQLEHTQSSVVRLVLDQPLRALAPGQSAVLYDGRVVLGGGIIC